MGSGLFGVTDLGGRAGNNLWVLPLSAGGYFLDRSIDTLLNKVVLDWNGNVMSVWSYDRLAQMSDSVPLRRVACSEEGCGLLTDGQTCQCNQLIEDTPWLRAAFQVCRLLVVFIEGGDLCSLNREILPETCEIGVQGVSFAGYKFAFLAIPAHSTAFKKSWERIDVLQMCPGMYQDDAGQV